MTNNWIFDYDGVIGNTIPAIIEFTKYRHNYTHSQALTIIDAYASAPKHCRRTVNQESLDYARAWNLEFYEFMDKEIPILFEDFIHTIDQLKDTRCAIVTNNTIVSINPKLYSCPVKFEPILALEHGSSKEDRILEIVKLWETTTQEVKFLTDTNSDILEIAHTLPLSNIYCCTWGWNDFERASMHLPTSNILREFHDIEWV